MRSRLAITGLLVLVIPSVSVIKEAVYQSAVAVTLEAYRERARLTDAANRVRIEKGVKRGR